MKRIITHISIFLLLSFSALFAQSSESVPYVLLLSFDGYRYDYPSRGLSPVLDSIAKSGVAASALRPVFPSKTFPNHYSIITGQYPQNHGIISNNMTDPYKNRRFRLGAQDQITNPAWYFGEAFWETAERQGIRCASFFWPGSELTTEHRRPSVFKQYEHEFPYEQRVDTVVSWFNLPYGERPHFVTLYFDLTDTYGHRFGTSAPETDWAIAKLDSILARLVHGLKASSVKDSINLIIVSDHGMADISDDRMILIENLVSLDDVQVLDNGPLLTLRVESEKREAVFTSLKASENHYRAYLKSEMPAWYYFNSHPFMGDIILLPEIGWEIHTEKSLESAKKWGSKASHGWDNYAIEMHGIFFASGPLFKKGYRTGTLQNIDIYPLLCEIFQMDARTTIDGKLERIGFILR